jgi:hypothetical protein
LESKAKEDPGFFRASAADVVLVVVVLVLSIIGIVWIGRAQSEETQGPIAAVVYRGEDVVQELDLSVDAIFELPDEELRIEVRDGRVRIAASDCPHQICVNTGWIRNPRQVIACVPNEVLVTIESTEAPFLDAIAR